MTSARNYGLRGAWELAGKKKFSAGKYQLSINCWATWAKGDDLFRRKICIKLSGKSRRHFKFKSISRESCRFLCCVPRREKVVSTWRAIIALQFESCASNDAPMTSARNYGLRGARELAGVATRKLVLSCGTRPIPYYGPHTTLSSPFAQIFLTT